MSRFAPSVQTAPQPGRPFPDKEIFWGSQDGGCNHFPADMSVISHRKFSEIPMPLHAFGRAVSEALDRVWIVDEYLLKPDSMLGNRVEQILKWLHIDLVASDIRFLTAQRIDDGSGVLARFQERAQAIRDKQVRPEKACSIEVRTHLTKEFNFIHDRFAIIDDELWHFGGTVGGFHASVSAASRGWRASDHGAIEFFEMVWNAGGKK
jgi:hypothetical protein